MTLRNVVVMLALAVLAALAWITLRDQDVSAPKYPPTMPVFVKDEVVKVVAKIESRTLVLRRRTDRSDAWEVEVGTSTVRADAAVVDELLTTLLRQDVRGKFELAKLTPGDLAGYGLAAPSVSVEVTTPAGPKLVRYGKRTREGTGVYVDNGEGTDAWVVGGTVVDQLGQMLATGARSKRLTDLRLFDVGKVEVLKSGVTTFEASRDANQIWRVTQPFAGFAEPTEFEQHLSRLVGTEVIEWTEVGAQDLKAYGLDAPAAEIRLTAKKGGDPSVVLLGKLTDRGVFAMEAGRPNVALVAARLLEGATADPAALRDRSFTRLGIDGVGLAVKIGDVAYDLRKEGSSWDVVKPDRFPGDDSAVRSALEAIRSWKTVEFLDTAKPDEYGLGEGCDQVEIELQSGGKTTLLLGKEASGGTWFARRRSSEGEGGVERVDASVVKMLAAGYLQFRRKTVRDFSTFLPDLARLARDAGRSDEGQKVQTIVVENVPAGGTAKAGWKLSEKDGPGVTGTLDNAALDRLLQRLVTIVTSEWLFHDSSKNEAMGFYPPLAETAALTFRFSARTGTPPGGAEQVLMIGKRREGGGYHAKFSSDEGWAFILSDSDVKGLLETLTK